MKYLVFPSSPSVEILRMPPFFRMTNHHRRPHFVVDWDTWHLWWHMWLRMTGWLVYKCPAAPYCKGLWCIIQSGCQEIPTLSCRTLQQNNGVAVDWVVPTNQGTVPALLQDCPWTGPAHIWWRIIWPGQQGFLLVYPVPVLTKSTLKRLFVFWFFMIFNLFPHFNFLVSI